MAREPVDCIGKPLRIGDWVTARSPRGRGFEGEIVRVRRDPRGGGTMGWLDIKTAAGPELSSRPSMCAKGERP